MNDFDIKLSEGEEAAFESIAKSPTGILFLGYLKRLIDHVSDIRTIKGEDMAKQVNVRADAVKIIEDHVIQPIKQFSENLEGAGNEDYS